MSMPKGFHGRVEAARVLFSRLIDVANFCDILDLLDRAEQIELVHTLGWLNVFNPDKPDRYYELDLSVLEDYNMAKILIRLAVIEEVARHAARITDGGRRETIGWTATHIRRPRTNHLFQIGSCLLPGTLKTLAKAKGHGELAFCGLRSRPSSKMVVFQTGMHARRSKSAFCVVLDVSWGTIAAS
ncbi:hypothetical protein Ae201684_005192 [Aphanomyces euteiches]|uniref:Uncharacterized protein n=1 Tax=Aphanomyces euteiches TaxID=100861 RepID=A0A6G0XFX0_9STRA|nr:hypothetical protein Ae201684_005192 [Aphanomyces euteiches]